MCCSSEWVDTEKNRATNLLQLYYTIEGEMSSINKKSPKGSTVRATAGEKSRSSNRGSDKKADGASSEVSTMPAPVLNESESDSERHSEAQPATDVTIYNAYDMGPAFGCKFPVPFIRFMVERVMSEKLKGRCEVRNLFEANFV